MSEMICIESIFPAAPNVRFTLGNGQCRELPDPDSAGGVAVARADNSLRHMAEQSSMRRARIRAIQAEIESGTYETAERISGTVDRLLAIRL